MVTEEFSKGFIASTLTYLAFNFIHLHLPIQATVTLALVTLVLLIKTDD